MKTVLDISDFIVGPYILTDVLHPDLIAASCGFIVEKWEKAEGSPYDEFLVRHRRNLDKSILITITSTGGANLFEKLHQKLTKMRDEIERLEQLNKDLKALGVVK